MSIRRASPVLLLALFVPALAFAADVTGGFVVRLGDDTTSVERYTRSRDKLVVDQVGRAPRTLRRHYVYEFQDGALTHFTMVVTPPGSSTPTQTIDATFDADSMHSRVQSGTAPVQETHAAVPRGTLVVASSSPWAGYEGRIQSQLRGKADTAGGNYYFIGATSLDRYRLERVGRDSVRLTTARGDEFRMRVDRAGGIVGSRAIAGTGKFALERNPAVDLDAIAAQWLAREQAGAGLGTLSPRDSVKTSVGGAALYVDYGRPAKRGRTVFGGIVPYGEVWRTGANAATQFRTDRTLTFAGQTLAPGLYTLWTIPGPAAWKLVVNSQTGQWGTAHDASKDLFAVDMVVSTLPTPAERFTISIEPSGSGGVLHLDWDTTRASVEFQVQP